MNHSLIIEFWSKILSILFLLFQGVMINAYLSKLYNQLWWSWMVADVTVLIIWISLLVVVNKPMWKKKNNDNEQYKSKPRNEVRYTYIAWLSYVILLCPRIVLLFYDLAKTLDEEDILGPNFLKMSVSCTPIVYFLLVFGSHTSKSYTIRHVSVQGIAMYGALDLFDSIDLLEFLFLPEEGVMFPRVYGHVSLLFACISFFLPALSLYGISDTVLPGRVTSASFKIMYELINLALINIPNLVIRSVLWHRYHMDVSVLLMKNIMGVIAASYEILEYMGAFRPIRCKKCGEWLEISAHGKHIETCAGTERVPMPPTSAEIVPLTSIQC